MNEKIYKGIELSLATSLSIGADYVITKAITNLVKPETTCDKILTAVGTCGINLAVDFGIASLIHQAMYPSEVSKYEELEKANISALEVTGEFNKVLAEHTLKIENTAEDILKKMEEMTNPEKVIKKALED